MNNWLKINDWRYLHAAGDWALDHDCGGWVLSSRRHKRAWPVLFGNPEESAEFLTKIEEAA